MITALPNSRAVVQLSLHGLMQLYHDNHEGQVGYSLSNQHVCKDIHTLNHTVTYIAVDTISILNLPAALVCFFCQIAINAFHQTGWQLNLVMHYSSLVRGAEKLAA